jgi:hypothetical protein
MPDSPILAQVATLFFALSCPTALAISLLFWGLVFDPATSVTGTDFLLHGVNAIVMLIDLLLNAQRMRSAHLIYSELIAILAGLWLYLQYALGVALPPGSLSCALCNGDRDSPGCLPDGGCLFIYPVINWGFPQLAGGTTAIVVLLAFPIIYFVTFAISILTTGRRWPKRTPCARVFSLDTLNGENWIDAWGWPSVRPLGKLGWLVIRLLLFLLWAAIFLWHITSTFDGGEWFYYLTNVSAPLRSQSTAVASVAARAHEPRGA